MTVALFALLESFDYGFGTLTRPGPGFLPMVYSGLMALLGLAILLGAWRDDRRLPGTRVWPVLSVTVALLSWIWLVPRAGFFVATVTLIVISATAHTGSRPLPVLILAVVSAILGGLLFIWVFGVPLPMWWQFGD